MAQNNLQKFLARSSLRKLNIRKNNPNKTKNPIETAITQDTRFRINSPSTQWSSQHYNITDNQIDKDIQSLRNQIESPLNLQRAPTILQRPYVRNLLPNFNNSINLQETNTDLQRTVASGQASDLILQNRQTSTQNQVVVSSSNSQDISTTTLTQATNSNLDLQQK